MLQSWRWFGPVDKVSLRDARQAGAEGIVTALHGLPAGEVWPLDAIERRKSEVTVFEDGNDSGLHWAVVESLPVSEDLKTRSGAWRDHLTAYKRSVRNLADAGIRTICYNFMPVLDWTRTGLRAPVASGGTTMQFELADFIAFDVCIFGRKGAGDAFEPEQVEEANRRFEGMSADARTALAKNVTMGLPGAVESWSLEGLREAVARYEGMGAEDLRSNHIEFMREIAAVAEECDVKLCCHPDDPPFSLLGLPRVMSTARDLQQFIDGVDSPSVGLTFCTGSLGARADNDLPAMARHFGPHIHFAHLRNVRRQSDAVPTSFFEDEHLGGQTDMVAVVAALLEEESRRRAEGRSDFVIPMRPDHGQDILNDDERAAQPGYPAIGRLKGLAELRGVIAALEHARLGTVA